MCSAIASPELVLTNGLGWLPVVVTAPTIQRSLDLENPSGEISIDYGKLSIRINPLFGNEIWSSYVFDGAPTKIWLGVPGAAFGTFTQIFDGASGPLMRNSKGQAEINLRGPETVLSKDALSLIYLGTGLGEGPVQLLNSLKPMALGFCENVDPTIIDPINFIYQYHGYGATQDVNNLYENAINLGASTATATTYAGLVALALKPGQWAKAPAVGMFRLGAQPSGKISADVSGALDGATFVQGAGEVSAWLLKQAGVSSGLISTASISTFDSVVRQPSFYAKAQTTFGEIIRKIVNDAFGYFYFNPSTQLWTFGRINYSKSAITLKNDRSSLPLVKHETITQGDSTAPAYSVRVGGRKCWSLHSDGEISPVAIINDRGAYDAAMVYQDGDLVSYLGGSYRYYFATPAFNILPNNTTYWTVSSLPSVMQASADASAAIIAATAANTALARIASDSWLSAGEKPDVVRERDAIVAEYGAMLTRATAMSITGELTATTTAYNALNTYLNALSPAYTDYGSDTVIVGSTFKTKFTDYYSAMAALRAKFTEVAAGTAVWTYVTGPGKPEDGATLGDNLQINSRLLIDTSGYNTAGFAMSRAAGTNGPPQAWVVESSASSSGAGQFIWPRSPFQGGRKLYISIQVMRTAALTTLLLAANQFYSLTGSGFGPLGGAIQIVPTVANVWQTFTIEAISAPDCGFMEMTVDNMTGNAGTVQIGAVRISYSAPGADVTSETQIAVTLSNTSVTYNADYLGTISGTISQETVRVSKGSTSIRGLDSTTYAITTSGGISATIDNTNGSSSKGEITISAFTGSAGAIEVTVTVAGAVQPKQKINFTKLFAAPPSAGGSTSKSAFDTSMNSITSTSYVTLTDAMSVSLASGESLYGTAPLDYYISGTTTASRTCTANWQYQLGSGAWTDFTGSAVTGTSSYSAHTTPSFPGEPGSYIDASPGTMSVTQTQGGLSANVYNIRLVALQSATGRTMTFVGTASVIAKV